DLDLRRGALPVDEPEPQVVHWVVVGAYDVAHLQSPHVVVGEGGVERQSVEAHGRAARVAELGAQARRRVEVAVGRRHWDVGDLHGGRGVGRHEGPRGVDQAAVGQAVDGDVSGYDVVEARDESRERVAGDQGLLEGDAHAGDGHGRVDARRQAADVDLQGAHL